MADQEFESADNFQGPAELRAAYERAVKALKERDKLIAAQAEEMKSHRIAKAGFPEGSEAFRLLADFYQDDLSDTEKMVEFAARYGHQPGAAAPSSLSEEDEVESGDQGLAALQGAATPIVPAGEAERIAAEITKAESEHRVRDAIALKNQLARLVESRRTTTRS